MIDLINCSFSYDSKQDIIKKVSLQIPDKSIYGLTGNNGSGKTTLLKLILGIFSTKEGEVLLFGKNISNEANRIEALRRIGSLIESPSLYPNLTVQEYLEVKQTLFNLPKKQVADCLQTVNLYEAKNKKTGSLSLGMKQRLAIANALLGDFDLLILDEPTNGLDPFGIIEIRNLLIELNQKHNKTILISSHLISEIEKTVTHLCILNNGSILFQGSLKEFQNSNELIYSLNTSDNSKALHLLSNLQYECNQLGENLYLKIQNQASTTEIIKLLIENQLDIYEIYKSNPSLEQQIINFKR